MSSFSIHLVRTCSSTSIFLVRPTLSSTPRQKMHTWCIHGWICSTTMWSCLIGLPTSSSKTKITSFNSSLITSSKSGLYTRSPAPIQRPLSSSSQTTMALLPDLCILTRPMRWKSSRQKQSLLRLSTTDRVIWWSRASSLRPLTLITWCRSYTPLPCSSWHRSRSTPSSQTWERWCTLKIWSV